PPHRHLPPFPTRRSSDLTATCCAALYASAHRLASHAHPRSPTADRRRARFMGFQEQSPDFSHSTEFSGEAPTPFVIPLQLCRRTDRKSTRLNSSHQIISY